VLQHLEVETKHISNTSFSGVTLLKLVFHYLEIKTKKKF